VSFAASARPPPPAAGVTHNEGLMAAANVRAYLLRHAAACGAYASAWAGRRHAESALSSRFLTRGPQ